jgi:hypothetical protein
MDYSMAMLGDKTSIFSNISQSLTLSGLQPTGFVGKIAKASHL